MSVWCEVEGKTYQNEKISLNRLLNELFNGDDYVINTGSTIDNFVFRICVDSDDAVNKVKLFISELDKRKARYDITTAIRWLN